MPRRGRHELRHLESGPSKGCTPAGSFREKGSVSSKGAAGANKNAEIDGRVATGGTITRKSTGTWSPFNDWWHREYERLGRMPSRAEVCAWYVEHAGAIWEDAKPSKEETWLHAVKLNDNKNREAITS